MILRTIGQGGMGAVYQARDLKRQALCAIKEMSLSMVPADERAQAIQNFKIEAKMLWSLNHANLPAFTGFFTEGQRYFMVMEYIDGATLEELLEQNRGPFPERRVLGWARQLCDVLEYLHGQNPPIIFRDMKPGNIMLTRDGHIKLIDFGIARLFRPSTSKDTQLLGTPGFAPPEQYGKAQTDERSDIYSFAITLFQLLTDTLPETGFSLKDVRAINPAISPVVARALEKAAALSPDDRFDTVAEFRRALLGVGTFFFENDDQATTPQELADLCARYPDEASDYLYAGEIESWLSEIGETELARAAKRIRTSTEDPQLAVEQFLQAVMGPNARIRNYSKTSIAGSGTIAAPTPSATPTSSRISRNGRSSRSGSVWFSRKPVSPVQVSPRTLDFGGVYPGVSAPLSLTITGDQGIAVRGIIKAVEPWIIVDQTQFDAMSTRVNVRVDSTALSGRLYSGTILILPEDDADEHTSNEIVVKVNADILGYMTSSLSNNNRSGKTIGADLDDYDEDDIINTGGMVAVSPRLKSATASVSSDAFSVDAARDSEYKKKYGQPGMNSGWDPLQASTRQRQWMQYGLTFVAACMLASLCYTVLAQVSSLMHVQPLPPNPWFIPILSGMVPLSMLGALVVNWNRSWSFGDAINRACTGMSGSLILLALGRLLWQVTLHAAYPQAQLLAMLFVAGLGATLGTNPTLSDYMLKGLDWALLRLRFLIFAFSVIFGGILGFLLSVGFGLSLFMPVGVILGVGVATALILRVDHLQKPHNTQQTP